MVSLICSPTSAEPRWTPLRRPERKTLGHQLAAIAEKLGQPLMPWQRYVADIGLEYELVDGVRVFCYREVIVTIPRQNGKTFLVLCWELHRALMSDSPQLVLYSAQTGADAREKFLKDHVPMIERSPLRAAVDKVERANGREGMLFRGGSRISIIASGASAGHGKTVGLGVVDEAFDDVDDRREQAFLPAMLTIRSAQLLVTSTMGTDASIYLNRKVDAGRRFAEVDAPNSDVAYFEWSAPDDCDLDDPLTWQLCMPAYGLTIGAPAIKHARATMLEGDFRRAMLNQRTQSEERVIPVHAWEKVQDASCQPTGMVQFAVDCNPERSAASIAVADQNRNVELVEHRPGTDWLVARVAELSRKWGATFLVDPAGPAGAFIAPLEQASVSITPCGGQEFTKACGRFFDAVMAEELHIRPHPSLDAAVAAAKKRIVGDAWVWARKSLSADISPLVAVSIAAAQAVQGTPRFFNLAEV